jgi:predicted AAA+ superfamily ATPase
MSDFFDTTELLSVLQGFNPWWTGRSYSVPQFHRIAYQVCRRYLDDPSLRRAVLLSGPRRVGKTTILNQIAAALVEEKREPKSILYLSLDHPLLKLVSVAEILRIYHESVHPAGKSVVLLLDEIQYSADWELHLKQLIDHLPEYRILATGSASVVHRQRVAESGVGRWIRVPIPTLSFYEFLHIRNEKPPTVPENLRPIDLFGKGEGDLADLASRFRGIQPLFHRYLLVGGFPETAKQSDIFLCQRLLREDVVERVLKRDMTALFGIRKVNDLERLFIYLCLHSGGILGVKTCADALGISPTTVSNHLDALEAANLIYRLRPSRISGRSVLKARDKVYLVDAALRNAVLLRGEEILADPQEMGTIVETTVLRHLFAYHYQETPEIVYWRDAKTGLEVDLIVRSPKYTLPVEIKYRENAEITEKSGLVAYCREEKISKAYWVTQRDRDFAVVEPHGLDTSVLRIPAHIFTYLLGQAERVLWLG